MGSGFSYAVQRQSPGSPIIKFATLFGLLVVELAVKIASQTGNRATFIPSGVIPIVALIL